MTYKRKKYHRGDTHVKKQWKVKRRKKDLDEVDEDLKEENAGKLLNQPIDFDKPGSGQFYCLHCARYFIDDQARAEHFRSKVHKRRLKELEETPYTVVDSERAAGFGSFKQPEFRVIETQKITAVNSREDKDGDISMKNLISV